ncbi:two-component system histidine kinase PnpS [Jeotgalibacillus sp. R-1-5s-1]|uniref:two-component system histidine kinase PnpS n=1 Tax=Jeotgalibacillus sp. R-1-5s-1 TaxID=2555897 RepID=UPI00352B2D2D
MKISSFRGRLLFALITLIFLVLIGLGILIGELVKSYYLNALHSRLEREVDIVIDQTERQSSFEELSLSEFNQLSDVLDTRISILDQEGVIIYDSGTGVSETVNHEEILEEISQSFPDREEGIVQFPQIDQTFYYAGAVETAGESGYVIMATSFNELGDVYRQIWIILAITLGIAMLIIIFLGARITSQYTKPIESATKVAIELAKGNYKARTFEDRVDETGMLSNAINVLARNLQEMVNDQAVQQDRLQTLIENMGSGLIMIDKQGYIVLVNRPFLSFFQMDLTEILNERYKDVFHDPRVREIAEEVFMTEQRVRKQVYTESTIPKRHLEIYGAPIIGERSAWQGIVLVFHDISELKKLEQMRKDFVANVSHEVKTPITSIKGFTETLLDGAMNDRDALDSFLTIILKESDRLQMLIQDLLDLSKVEQQGFKLSLSEVNLADLLEEVKMVIGQRAAEKKMHIVLELDPKSVIEGDFDRLKQVFINLLNNAITYSYNEGEIKVKTVRRGDRMLIHVIDNGIGMEKQEISRIFERFYRVDKARSRNSGGTGLGLAIVKHIVEVHHGEIQAASQVGKGTTFTIDLPVEQDKWN